MNAEEMFSIPCPNCGTAIGKPCSHWEGRPVACEVRADTVQRQREVHAYPPVWDETLKAYINNPPWGKPGQGAKL